MQRQGHLKPSQRKERIRDVRTSAGELKAIEKFALKRVYDQLFVGEALSRISKMRRKRAKSNLREKDKPRIFSSREIHLRVSTDGGKEDPKLIISRNVYGTKNSGGCLNAGLTANTKVGRLNLCEGCSLK